METQKSVLIEEKTIKKTYQAIDTWMSDCELPVAMKLEITKSLKENKVVEKNRDVDVDINFMLSVTPMALKNTFKEHICINALKRVLENMPEVALRMMCACAKPKVYHENSKIFNQGERLDAMIIIIKGTIICSKSAEQMRTSYSKGDCYGENLLKWKEGCTPTSDHNVHCRTKVEALVFTLESEMENFIDYWRIRNWDQNFTPLLEMTDSDIEIEKILIQRSEKWRIKEKSEDDEELIQKETTEHRALEPNQKIVQQVQGDHKLHEQLVLMRESILQFRNDMATQAWRLDDVTEILARLGYP